jgi:hypothetical protein
MQVTDGQLREMISLRAYAEPTFRKSLLANPKSTIESIIGSALPSNVKVSIIEESDNHLHIVIPQASTDELSEDQLSAVAGGFLDAKGEGSAVCVALGGGGLVTTKLELNVG